MIFKQIFGTSVGKLITSLSSFAMVVLSAHYIGVKGVGEISLILLGVTLIHLVSNCVGGPALVYLLPRHQLIHLLLPSVIWTGLCSIGGSFLLSLLHLLPVGYTVDLLIISFLVAINSMNLNILLGMKRIKWFNIIGTLQVVITLLVLLIEFVWLHHISIRIYLFAYYIGLVTSLVMSTLMVLPYLKPVTLSFPRQVLLDLIKYSPIMQVSTFSQMLNYRLSYYFIEFFYGTAVLGVFSVATQVAESVWIIGRGFATVHYTHVANQGDTMASRMLTRKLMKIVGVITLLLLVVMVFLPGTVYELLFGSGFSSARSIVILLAPGMLFTSISMILSHYFSGIGRPIKCMIGSLLGLGITLLLGVLLIPRFGVQGAAVTTSVSYLAGLAYLMCAFLRRAD